MSARRFRVLAVRSINLHINIRYIDIRILSRSYHVLMALASASVSGTGEFIDLWKFESLGMLALSLLVQQVAGGPPF